MKNFHPSTKITFALEELKDLVDSGVKFVPAQPTKIMTDAGARAGNVDEDQAARIYRAMVEADNLDDVMSANDDQRH